MPITRTTPSFSPTSTVFSVTSSLTRSPLAYISSSIVRSRKPSGVSTSGAPSSASTCASDSVDGNRAACFADVIRSVGSALARCSRTAQP
ncbi:hypothetical protein BGV71_28500 [Burkholderia ubonensis]|nr:hypothetical protein BGV71_28500 [Burkholderia ubonensis]